MVIFFLYRIIQPPGLIFCPLRFWWLRWHSTIPSSVGPSNHLICFFPWGYHQLHDCHIKYSDILEICVSDALLPNKSIKPVSLSDYKGKWVVLFFYPLDFTFVCPTEIVAFSEASAAFEALNTQVIGASVDSVFCHLAWVNTDRKNGGLGEMKIPLIEDLTKQISTDYGVLHMNSGHTHRGLFIIDDKGILRHITMNDPPVGRNTEEIKRLVEAYQYVDKHGEVCPANWSNGKATIKPDVSGSKEYFSKNA